MGFFRFWRLGEFLESFNLEFSGNFIKLPEKICDPVFCLGLLLLTLEFPLNYTKLTALRFSYFVLDSFD